MTSKKIPATNRHHGGPGSSHQRPDLPDPAERRTASDEDSPERHSKVSGGGGERDSHHTHDPELKGDRSGR